uniref:Selenoprotein K n=1 Tax=Aureoumbra lagunensis TaxID=44058 RepID=A0A7S3JVS3_9STRA|mmetsp:Transcript_19055/g.24696  ORF Transcript_19055/g.24696 Transcript_19055/m.24696 type:complete len:101 (+) Transcript_19055:70-372(+)
MPYLNADGNIVSKRSMFRFSILFDLFWGIIDFIHFFFLTMFDPESTHHSLRPSRRSTGRPSGRGGGNDGPPGQGGGGRPKPRIRGIGDMPASTMRAAAGG